MTINFKNISKDEYDLLQNFPAYVSLLAANKGEEMVLSEELSAIEFSHIKTYVCNPLLTDFFKEVNKNFERSLKELNNSLPQDRVNRDASLKSRLLEIERTILKLEPEGVAIIRRSMKTFKVHVSRAHHNILVDFLFPTPISELSDY